VEFSRQIRAWLKAGVIDAGQMFETIEGTPQGGVISPLLANVALHGIEERVKSLAGNNKVKRQELTVVRYADDFVVLHKDRDTLDQAQRVIAEWLKEMGLELKPEKTKITHTLHSDNPGFDFLGFNVRQYEVGKYHTGKNGHGKPLGFKTLVKPSNKSIGKHKERLAAIVARHQAAPQAALISKLNPVIRGWSNYFRTGISKEIFSDLDHYLWKILWNWAKRRHSNKSKHWIARRYWSIDQDGQWRFRCQTEKGEVELFLHSHVEIIRHVKVKGPASPYDGNLTYWSTRLGKNPELSNRVAKLLKKQKGKCQQCSLMFRNEDSWEIDHIKPLSLGGLDQWDNIQLIHRHCHDVKTANDGSCRVHDKDGLIEEPDEVKVSCPVLKTSRGGDPLA